MTTYIHQRRSWPNFTWKEENLLRSLAAIRHQQGKLLGQMQGLGFQLQAEATLETLTLDVLKSSEIEGEILDRDQVRSSIARRLGIEIAGLVPADRHVEGIVEIMLDATQNAGLPLTEERLFSWHAALFPNGRAGMQKILVGAWRNNAPDDPMLVVSGPIGKEKIHYRAPDAALIQDEMNAFIKWFNTEHSIDPVIKAAIAHLWLVTIHPFADGNGRIARAIADMQLAKSDGSKQRFYSMSAQIRKERNAYYDMLEQTQQGTMDISAWLQWFLECLGRALLTSEQTLAKVLRKARFWETSKYLPLNERQKNMLNKMLDGFEGKLNSSKWAKITNCSSDTALRDINDLLQRKILEKEIGGGRSTSYVLNEHA